MIARHKPLSYRDLCDLLLLVFFWAASEFGILAYFAGIDSSGSFFLNCWINTGLRLVLCQD